MVRPARVSLSHQAGRAQKECGKNQECFESADRGKSTKLRHF
jgi:hypothetical protein